MNKIVEGFDNNVNSVLLKAYSPSLVKGALHLVLILYAAWIAPTPPQAILNLFENVYFKLFVFSLILWTAQFSPSTSILIALAFMVTVNYTTTGKLWENLENESTDTYQTSVDAVTVLAGATLEPMPTEPVVVDSLVQDALKSVTTPEGEQAVSNLAIQASISEAGDQEKVADALKVAIDSMVPSQTSGCYPSRSYDMSKVSGVKEEKYFPWTLL